MIPRLRIALRSTDSPHIDAVRLALFGWAVARSLDADLIVRIDDDAVPSSAEKVSNLLAALRWVGLDWDEGPDIGGDFAPYVQSQRQTMRQAAAAQRPPSESSASGELLATVLDDHAQGITHVVCHQTGLARASDQMAIYNAFGWSPPQFVYVPPLVNGAGQPLPMRDRQGGYRLRDWQQAGYVPQAIWSYLLQLGWTAQTAQPLLTKWTVRKQFQLAQLKREPQRFEWGRLRECNQHALEKLSTPQLAAQLRDFLEDAYGALPNSERWLFDLTEAVRDELIVLDDVVELAEWAFEMPDTIAAAHTALLSPAARPTLTHLLAEIATVVLLDSATADSMLRSVTMRMQTQYGWQPEQILQPARAALTGQVDGPKLANVLGLLGKQRSMERIGAALVS